MTDTNQPEDALETLVHQKIISESDAEAFREQTTQGPRKRFDEVLVDLKAAGLLSDFQRRRIDDDGIEALRMGPYILLEHLGKGGMGEVLMARHVELDRKVALKILPPQLTDSEERKERFRREIRLLAKLDHPGIVKAIDAGQWKEVPYLAMEYVEGGTLQDLLADEGPVAWNRLVRWMIPICDALDYAHNQGIIHRDIKPSNLAVDKVKGIKVLDLGLARAIQVEGDASTDGFATSADQMLGTADFIPPEQTAGDVGVTPAADVYSLGCTLFTLLTGRPIFPGSNVLEKVMSHRKDPPPDLTELRPEVPTEVNQLIQTMVAKKPSDRPASMRHVTDRLSEIAKQYHLGDSTVPGGLATSDSTVASGDSSRVEQERSAAGSSLPELPIHLAAQADRQASPLGYLLVGVVTAIALIAIGAWGVIKLNSKGDADVRAADTARTETAEEKPAQSQSAASQDRVEATASQQDDTNALASLLTTIQLAGGEVELPDPLPDGSLKPISGQQVPRSLPPEIAFGVRFRSGPPTPQLLRNVVAETGLTHLAIASDVAGSVSLSDIAKAEQIRQLELDARSFSAAEIVWLRKMLGLRQLVVSQAERSHIDRILSLDQVVDLSLPSRRYGAAAIQALAQMNWLERLSFPIAEIEPDVISQVYQAIPNCQLDFQTDSESDAAHVLIHMALQAKDSPHEESLSQRIADHQTQLVQDGSMNAFWGMTRYIDELGKSLPRDEQISLYRETLAMNGDLQDATEGTNNLVRLREQAGRKWSVLGQIYQFSNEGDRETRLAEAVKCYLKSIENFEAVDPVRHAGSLAAEAGKIASIYSADRPELAQQWVQTTLDYLDARPGNSQSGSVFWGWNRIGDTVARTAPQDAIKYYAQAITAIEDVNQWTMDCLWKIGKLLLQEQRFAEAKQRVTQGLEGLESFHGPPTKTVEFKQRLLCLSAAIALQEKDTQAFTLATDQLVAIPGRVNPGWLNYDVWDIVCLRGWRNPLEADAILVQFERSGPWPPVARQLAIGNLELESFLELEPPRQDSSRFLLHEALRLNLDSSIDATQARQKADELWQRQAEYAEPVRAAVLGAALATLSQSIAREVTQDAANRETQEQAEVTEQKNESEDLP